LYVSRWKLRRLIRQGAAASATIIEKKEIAGRPSRHTIHYEYRVPSEAVDGQVLSTPVLLTASMKVRPQDYQQAQIGDQVVVLYHPERPRRSVIYRYSDYGCVPA